jgi:ABC-type multidrug transport system fused ATPase/permease subunit
MTNSITEDNSWRHVTRIALEALQPADRRKLKLIVVVQICLGLLDLLALALVGLLGSMAVKGITSPPQASEINLFLLRNLGVISFQKQVAIIGLIAAFFLIGRTAITMYLTRRTLFFLSLKSAVLTANLVRKLLSKDLLTVMSKSRQETLFALTGGVNMIFVGLLGAGIQILADASLMILMTVGLFVVDPLISIASIALFGSISALLYFLMHTKAAKLGDERTELNIESAEKIIEVMDTYREAVVRNRRTFYSDKISNLRMNLARAEAEIAFMPSVSKYVIEISVVIGALAICGLQFAIKDAIQAVATLAVFMTAGTRIAPAILRLQQSAIAVKTALSSASPSIRLLESLKGESLLESTYSNIIETDHSDFVSRVEFKNVSFSYPGEKFALTNINFEINPGEFVAVVGASGSGKTTLVDLLLGILIPTSGEVTLSGVTPHEAIQGWPGAISYVPQDVLLIKGSVKENVGLGYDASSLKSTVLEDALLAASINEFVNQLPNGVNTNIGDGGQKLSGGQRQRLGIARSLITDPRLLVLDEATSALDGQTESDISNTLFSLRGKRTVVVIAHRLSSVRNADSVIYMDKGQILAKGNFEQVRSAIPDFDSQAKLMGL